MMDDAELIASSREFTGGWTGAVTSPPRRSRVRGAWEVSTTRVTKLFNREDLRPSVRACFQMLGRGNQSNSGREESDPP